MTEVFCNQCGHKNPAGARFCSSCGSPLDQPREEHTAAFAIPESGLEGDPAIAAPPDIAEGIGVLLITRGAGAGSRYSLDRDVVSVGRHPDSDIFLDDITVSRRHAEFVRSEGGHRIRDVGSLNGTYLNRERIEDASLSSGDELQIGKFKLVFFTGPAA